MISKGTKVSELTAEDIKKLPDEEFLEIIINTLTNNEKNIPKLKEFKEYITQIIVTFKKSN